MFQSLVGRLKTGEVIAEMSQCAYWFQSLVGRLKTVSAFKLTDDIKEFQSLVGRLKTCNLPLQTAYCSSVSIPRR